MNQKITAENWTDTDGNPTGGTAVGKGIIIIWQNGPLGRGADRMEPNGAFVEGVIEAARQRLEFFQTAGGGRFACGENASAIEHLGMALYMLNARTQAREARQVEGTHTP